MSEVRWFVLNVNPERWAIGPVGLGKSRTPYVGRNQELAAYQEAVKEAITAEYPDIEPLEGEIDLRFYLWRQVGKYESLATGRKITKNEVDTTNMQKALEDALQGILYANDKKVRSIKTEVVAQGVDQEGKIVICIQPWYAFDVEEIPDSVWAEIDGQDKLEFDSYDDKPEVW